MKKQDHWRGTAAISCLHPDFCWHLENNPDYKQHLESAAGVQILICLPAKSLMECLLMMDE